jgi:hypothetical protein
MVGEPLANVGQWAPIAGTVLAVLGSLYVLLAQAIEHEREHRRHTDIADDEAGSGITHRIAEVVLDVTYCINHPIEKRFEESDFQLGDASRWPEIPAESLRNLSQTRSNYNPYRGSSSSSVSGVSRKRSAAVGSIKFGAANEHALSLECLAESTNLPDHFSEVVEPP